MKNSLGVDVTISDKTLVIMRGIPGSGKSTAAKMLLSTVPLGEGAIHSTDDVIEANGDYRVFFEQMIASKNFAPLSKAHSTNLKNAKQSLLEGKKIVIIDNTNIKPNEAKNYVVEALKMGYGDNSILIIDVGTGNSTAKALAERNKHGVPLEKIESMIMAHKSVGELTLKKILEAKDMYNDSGILYSAVVLDKASKNLLFERLGSYIP
jgi:predicted kinase